ncbi:MAG TPA: hypothetical protein VKI00_28470 [Mycobacterium sp.]|uniref:hypothetical protein n=1 Tax=Mycobacterium sp. TaxID=1785 RepID=UPI002D125ADB|nr:hypothetical protein [Mycobacterium sp.]HME79456.1 hypothetical protein [Mycobacterium sp.]
MSNDQPSDAVLAGLSLAWVIIIVVVWLVSAFVAGLVAPKDRAVMFFWLTVLILGPLGALAASVAQSREPLYDAPPARPIAPGRRRFICPRCGAENDVPQPDASYDCWRCSEHRTVQPAMPAVRQPTKAAGSATVAGAGAVKDLASEIDSKLTDFDAGRISLAELEIYLKRAESSLPKGPGTTPQRLGGVD